jgi:transposase InsO family protein
MRSFLNNPFPIKTNQVWAGDITCIPIISGWIYLAVVIFHSDRGSQRGRAVYCQVLNHFGPRQSVSARANPYHNAWTESFM